MHWLLIGFLLLISPLLIFVVGAFIFIFAECLLCIWATVFAAFGYRGLERFCMKHCPHLYGSPWPFGRK